MRRSSRPALPPRRLIVLLAAGGGLILVLAGWLGYYLALRPPATAGSPHQFAVTAGQNAPTIARRLYAAGLIRSPTAFVTYVNLHGLRPQLKVGLYSLAPIQSSQTIAAILAGGLTVTKRLVIPEGYRLSQIADAAAAEGISRAAFMQALAAPHTQTFLSAKPAASGLEGYLFPDSYQIDTNTIAPSLVNAMLDNFGHKVGSEYAQAFAAQGLTLHQGLTLASIVEREVSRPADRPIVAQIFLKRYRTGMMLGSDVTTHYAADLLGVPFNLDLSSPYNTRKFAGLPPGPICSPGLGSLDAVAHPAATDYLYFLSGKDGQTYFAKTYAEHQANIAKHL